MSGLLAILATEGRVSVEGLRGGLRAFNRTGDDVETVWSERDLIAVGVGHSPQSKNISSQNEDGVYVSIFGDVLDVNETNRYLRDPSDAISAPQLVARLYRHYGPRFLQFIQGECAIVLWDSRNEQLFVARDRFGTKSICYTTVGRTLYVASEAKALWASGVPARWDEETVFQDLFFGCPEDRTLFRDVHRIPTGCCLVASRHHQRIFRYWDDDYPIGEPTKSNEEFVESYRDALVQAVKSRIALYGGRTGFALSGGFDSSLALGIATKLSGSSYTAFTQALDHAEFSDSEDPLHPYAVEAARFNKADLVVTATPRKDMFEAYERTILGYECAKDEIVFAVLWFVGKTAHERNYYRIMCGDYHDFLMFTQKQLDSVPSDREKSPLVQGPNRLSAAIDRYGFLPAAMAARKRFLLGNGLRPIFGNFVAEKKELDPIAMHLAAIALPPAYYQWPQYQQQMYLHRRVIASNHQSFGGLHASTSTDWTSPFLDTRVFGVIRQLPQSLLIDKKIARDAAVSLIPESIRTMPRSGALFAPIKRDGSDPLYNQAKEKIRSMAKAVPFFEEKAVYAFFEKYEAYETLPPPLDWGFEMAVCFLLSLCILQEKFRPGL